MQSQILNAQQTAASDAAAGKVPSGPSKVALIHGDDRRKNVLKALETIDSQIAPTLRTKKYVVIKPNLVSTTYQLAATHVDALHGILDYLQPRFHGPVIIAESSAGNTPEGFDNFKYNQLVTDRSAQNVKLVDLNHEGKYETIEVIDADLHITPVRLAAMVLDPDAYVISSAMLKTHNTVVATLSVKNMVLGSPLHSVKGETEWNDKRKYHVGLRQTHYNMLVTAQKLQPNWGVAVIDGFEGMEGNGPAWGTPVDSRLAIASTDFVAADRVGIELMGINPEWVGYLNYCAQAGLGQYDLSKIEVIGATVASLQKKYELHKDVEKELKWMGPLDVKQTNLGNLSYPYNIDDLVNG